MDIYIYIYIYIYVNICANIYLCADIYIYIYREREREREKQIYTDRERESERIHVLLLFVATCAHAQDCAHCCASSAYGTLLLVVHSIFGCSQSWLYASLVAGYRKRGLVSKTLRCTGDSWYYEQYVV